MERSYKPRYATAPLGASGDITNSKPRSIEWDFQSITFLISMGFQLATLILSAITLGNSGEPNPAPPLLIIVVAMELIVQCVEIVWYSLVGVFYYFGQLSIGVRYRYYDWVITTPVGLTVLIIFVWYLECQSSTAEILSEPSRIITMVVIVLFDWMMLFIGYAYEAELDAREWINKAVPFIGSFLKDPAVMESKNAMVGQEKLYDSRYSLYAYRGLLIGWIPFFGIFIPMFVALGTAKPTGNVFGFGVFAVTATFTTWGLYGIVALYYRKPESAKMKNAAYNILDIVSKNPSPITPYVACVVAYVCVILCVAGEQKHRRVDHKHRGAQPLIRNGYTMERYRMQRNFVLNSGPGLFVRVQREKECTPQDTHSCRKNHVSRCGCACDASKGNGSSNGVEAKEKCKVEAVEV